MKPNPTVIIAEQRDKIIGFASYDAYEEGKFGPIGVAEGQRKRGIGVVMLSEAFQKMKENGLKEILVHWTSHLFFYSQVPGIKRVRHYWIMRKSI